MDGLPIFNKDFNIKNCEEHKTHLPVVESGVENRFPSKFGTVNSQVVQSLYSQYLYFWKYNFREEIS